MRKVPEYIFEHVSPEEFEKFDDYEVIEEIEKIIKVVKSDTHILVPYRVLQCLLKNGTYISILFEEYNIEEPSNSENNIKLWRVTEEPIIDKFEDEKLEDYDSGKKYEIWPTGVNYLEQSKECCYAVDYDIDTHVTLDSMD